MFEQREGVEKREVRCLSRGEGVERGRCLSRWRGREEGGAVFERAEKRDVR